MKLVSLNYQEMAAEASSQS